MKKTSLLTTSPGAKMNMAYMVIFLRNSVNIAEVEVTNQTSKTGGMSANQPRMDAIHTDRPDT